MQQVSKRETITSKISKNQNYFINSQQKVYQIYVTQLIKLHNFHAAILLILCKSSIKFILLLFTNERKMKW
jgi:hypothetical protein